MSCTISKARKVDCRDQLGGIKKVFFFDEYYDDVVVLATLNGTDVNQIDTLGQAITFLQYDLRPDESSMTINVSGDATGNVMYEQTLNLVLHRVTAQDSIALQQLGRNRSQIAVLSTNDEVFVLGAKEGANLTGGGVTSGATRTERTGLTMDFTATEDQAYYLIKKGAGPGSGTATAKYPFDGLSDSASNVTITVQA